jgi:protein-tyrosine phosphatase
MQDDKITFLNFRDMGGLETADGRVFKYKKLYRTARFAPRTKADRTYINDMRLDTVVDLRSKQELKEKPDRVPAGVEYVHAPVFRDPAFNVLAPTLKTSVRVIFSSPEYLAAMKDTILRSYAVMPYEAQAFGEIFARMDEGKTIAFHCTAGKDRTGIAAVLIELALGRSIAQCKEEYLKSNDLRKKFVEETAKKLNLLRVSPHAREFCVYSSLTHEPLFNEAIKAIFDKYDTVDQFLKDVYGIDEARKNKWKQFYLEEPSSQNN